MTRILGATLITMIFLMITILTYGLVTVYYKGEDYRKDYAKGQLITIEIDGQEYLYGNYNKNVVIVPKTKKCSCDTIK